MAYYRQEQRMAHMPEQSNISYFLQELASHPPSDAMSISSGGLSENGSVLLEAFNRVADERDAARRDLSSAMETIEELKNHISGLNSLLSDTQRELETQKSINSRQQPHAEPRSRERWIGNIWLSHPWLRCIHEAEKQWRDGNPQQTLNIMFHRLAADDLDFEEQTMCRLLVAAVFHRSGNTGQSMLIADDVLKCSESYSHKDPFLAREVSGIAQFLRGKNLMSDGNWAQAYWAFARATSNRRYKMKAQRLQKIVAESIHVEESIPYVPPVQPLFSDGSRRFAATSRSPMDFPCFSQPR